MKTNEIITWANRLVRVIPSVLLALIPTFVYGFLLWLTYSTGWWKVSITLGLLIWMIVQIWLGITIVMSWAEQPTESSLRHKRG